MSTEHDCCKLKVKSSIWYNYQDIFKSVKKPKNKENMGKDKLVWNMLTPDLEKVVKYPQAEGSEFWNILKIA